MLKRSAQFVGASVACVSLMFAACDSDDAAPSSTPSPEAATAAATTLPTATTTVTTTTGTGTATEPIPDAVVGAMQAAASDAGVSIDQVSLLSYRRAEWTSSALGCPEPGKGYAQVITPGFEVRLVVAGEEVEYHTDLRSNVVRC